MNEHERLENLSAELSDCFPAEAWCKSSQLLARISTYGARQAAPEAASSGNGVPTCMIGGKCADFRAKTVELSGHLPHNLKHHRRRIAGYLDAPANKLSYEAFPGRTERESERYLTPAQQEALLEWLGEKHSELFK